LADDNLAIPQSTIHLKDFKRATSNEKTKNKMFQLFDKSTIEAMSRRKTLAEAKDNYGGEQQPQQQNGGISSGGSGLRRSLTAIDLVLYGVGSSVGAGIFVLVGLGAKIAGPAISLSFLGCGMACVLTSLAYSEFASLIPASGSAFT
jgi:amino acid permease